MGSLKDVEGLLPYLILILNNSVIFLHFIPFLKTTFNIYLI